MFLQADAALRCVVDQITPAQLDLPAPAEWSRKKNPTLRDILASHAEDEAWLPAVLEGRTIEEVGDTYQGDLLGDDPIGNYDRLNELTTKVVTGNLDPDKVVHLSYGDYPSAKLCSTPPCTGRSRPGASPSTSVSTTRCPTCWSRTSGNRSRPTSKCGAASVFFRPKWRYPRPQIARCSCSARSATGANSPALLRRDPVVEVLEHHARSGGRHGGVG